MPDDLPAPEPRVLITGFEPFGGERTNPAAAVAEAVADDAGIASRIVPTTFAAAAVLASEWAGRWPPLVIAMGQAAGRAAITIERYAVNREDTGPTPANDGDSPTGRPIDPQGAAGLAATLDVDRAVAAARDAGVPAAASLSAGTHCCNALLYRLIAATRGTSTAVGFVHLPALPDQRLDGSTPTMHLDLAVRGVRAVIAELAPR